MQFPAQIQAAIELLDESISSKYPADRLMSNYFRSRRYIGSKDKAAISSYFYRALRSRSSLQYLLQQQGVAGDAKFVLAALLQLEGEDLGSTFTGQQYQPARLKFEYRERVQSIDETQLADAPDAVRLNVPEWLEGKLKAALGDGFEQEMLAANQRASTDIRANTLSIDKESLVEKLQKLDFHAEQTPYSPWGLRFFERVALFNTDLFRQGGFEVQDEGSQLLALASGVKAGDKAVDFCAGAGGKTLAMAAMMNNKGTLYACDVHSRRLQEAQKRAKRAGAHNIRIHHLSSEKDKWVKQHAKSADMVLIDAPCSGTGTWRRNPDSRWNFDGEQLENLIALQSSILQSAARLVKPGGRLIYATCSLLLEENEHQVKEFLSSNQEFEAAPLVDEIAALFPPPGKLGQLRLSTAQHATDGFFLSVMQRLA